MKTTTKIDLGTKEISKGIFKNSDGTYTAICLKCGSIWFKGIWRTKKAMGEMDQ